MAPADLLLPAVTHKGLTFECVFFVLLLINYNNKIRGEKSIPANKRQTKRNNFSYNFNFYCFQNISVIFKRTILFLRFFLLSWWLAVASNCSFWWLLLLPACSQPAWCCFCCCHCWQLLIWNYGFLNCTYFIHNCNNAVIKIIVF